MSEENNYIRSNLDGVPDSGVERAIYEAAYDGFSKACEVYGGESPDSKFYTWWDYEDGRDTTEQNAKKAMKFQDAGANKPISVSDTDKQKRDKTVDDFASAMKRRLDDKAAEGFSGWDSNVEDLNLEQRIHDKAEGLKHRHLPEEEIECLDIANFAMMLWREE